MKYINLIRVLAVYSLFIFIGLGILGGCETSPVSEDGDTELSPCDLSGADSACNICAELGDAACCTLTSPAGCGTVNQILTFTSCSTDQSAACAIGGSSLAIDRKRTAVLLGFAGLMKNSVDATSARVPEPWKAWVPIYAST